MTNTRYRIITGRAAREVSQHIGSVKIRHKTRVGFEATIPQSTRIATEIQDIDITIDVEALLDFMGRRAMSAKAGVSKFQGGLITARTKGKRVVVKEETKPVPVWADYEIVEEEKA